MVGETGFEPATLWSQTRCATRLRYSPTLEDAYHRLGDKKQAPSMQAGWNLCVKGRVLRRNRWGITPTKTEDARSRHPRGRNSD